MVTAVSGSNNTQATSTVTATKPQKGANEAPEPKKTQPQDTAVFSKAALDKAKEISERNKAEEAAETPTQETQEGTRGKAPSLNSLVGG